MQQDYSIVPQGSTAALEWVIGGPDHLLVGESRQLSDQTFSFVLAYELGHVQVQLRRKLLEGVATERDRTLPDLALLTQYRAVLAEEARRAQRVVPDD